MRSRTVALHQKGPRRQGGAWECSLEGTTLRLPPVEVGLVRARGWERTHQKRFENEQLKPSALGRGAALSCRSGERLSAERSPGCGGPDAQSERIKTEHRYRNNRRRKAERRVFPVRDKLESGAD